VENQGARPPAVKLGAQAPDDDARIAAALHHAWNSGAVAEFGGSHNGNGRVADALPVAHWLLANVGALPELPSGSTEAQITAIAVEVGLHFGH